MLWLHFSLILSQRVCYSFNVFQDIPGITDVTVPKRLGPKRASRIRKLFNLTKDDDVQQYVIRRALPVKEGKKQKYKTPKIQRLVTPVVLQVECGYILYF